MCKDAWIPEAQQTAAVFVLDKVLLTFQQSPSRGEGNVTLQGMERDLDHVQKGQCLHLLLPEHSGHPFHQPVSSGSRGKSAAKHVHSTLQKKGYRRPGYASPHQPAAGSLQKRPSRLLPALGRCAGLALERALPQLSKGFLLPYRGKLSILTHSQPDVKGLQPVVYNIFFKRPLRINNFYCNFQLHHALVKLD